MIIKEKIYKMPKLWYNKGVGGVYIEQERHKKNININEDSRK